VPQGHSPNQHWTDDQQLAPGLWLASGNVLSFEVDPILFVPTVSWAQNRRPILCIQAPVSHNE
jgi:hypothetical protein